MENEWTPNLIMPGVAKCGTTTIYDLLVSHPRVTGGIEKEIRFLMDEDDELATSQNVRDNGLAGWAGQFADRGTGDFDIWLDASPQYQYQQVAIDTIARLDPQPKVLFVVRRPSARLFSLYQYARYHQKRLPHVKSFAQFIEEIRPPVDHRLSDQKMMVNAWNDSRYDLMLSRWSEVVSADKLFVTSVEELGDEREKVLRELAAWLGIDPEPLVHSRVDRSNPTVKTRSTLLRKVGGRAAQVLPETRLIRHIKTFVRELNSSPLDRDELSRNSNLIEQLDAEFAPAMAEFEALRQTLGLVRKPAKKA